MLLLLLLLVVVVVVKGRHPTMYDHGSSWSRGKRRDMYARRSSIWTGSVYMLEKKKKK